VSSGLLATQIYGLFPSTVEDFHLPSAVLVFWTAVSIRKYRWGQEVI